jgi:DNA-binding IclR family transcriptional regulator
LTSLSALHEELDRVLQAGYAIDDEENHVGIRCVAAPVFREDGTVLGGVSVTSPAFRFSIDDAVALAPRVQEVARAISTALGWDGVAKAAHG